MKKSRFIRNCFKPVLLLAIVSLFSIPLQANERSANIVAPNFKPQPGSDAAQLPFASVPTEVVKIISEVGGEPVTDDNATLGAMHFDKVMIKEVARRVSSFVNEKSRNRSSISSSSITQESTTNAIIRLVMRTLEL